jgi:glutathione S-transferase
VSAQEPPSYRVYGMSQSFFTRKLEGTLAYKGIPYRLRRCAGGVPDARAAGWPGGVPVVRTPEGAWCWDTTDVIHHLEARFPEPAVLPPDPVQRFLCYALEDFADEWLYRCAVGSRWHFEENHRVGGYELARDLTHEAPVSADQAAQLVRAHVSATCEPFGVTPANVQSWIDESLRPFQRALERHLAARPYLFGERPSLADFALFGGCAAHFANDPLCRRWLDEDAPALVKHTQRLTEPEDQAFGPWAPAGDVPDTLARLLAELGRHYLPWVSRAAAAGRAELAFAGGARVEIAATPFLANARAVLLARYAALRSDALDAALGRAGVLRFYADDVARAGSIPDPAEPPRPARNRPFPPPWEAER